MTTGVKDAEGGMETTEKGLLEPQGQDSTVEKKMIAGEQATKRDSTWGEIAAGLSDFQWPTEIQSLLERMEKVVLAFQLADLPFWIGKIRIPRGYMPKGRSDIDTRRLRWGPPEYAVENRMPVDISAQLDVPLRVIEVLIADFPEIIEPLAVFHRAWGSDYSRRSESDAGLKEDIDPKVVMAKFVLLFEWVGGIKSMYVPQNSNDYHPTTEAQYNQLDQLKEQILLLRKLYPEIVDSIFRDILEGNLHMELHNVFHILDAEDPLFLAYARKILAEDNVSAIYKFVGLYVHYGADNEELVMKMIRRLLEEEKLGSRHYRHLYVQVRHYRQVKNPLKNIPLSLQVLELLENQEKLRKGQEEERKRRQWEESQKKRLEREKAERE